MSFETIARDYLSRFKQVCDGVQRDGQGSVELPSRPVVHQFIERVAKSIQPNVVVHHDVMVRATSDRPDWRFEHKINFGVFAYGDHKNLNRVGPFKLLANGREQIGRYLELGRPVFVFDGIEFLFFAGDVKDPERVELVPKPLPDSDWSKLPINPLVEVRFKELLENPGFRQWTEEELIRQLARRARLVSRSIESLLAAPPGSGVDAAEEGLIANLHSLWVIVRDHHDPTLADRRKCADFIAQVLVFGLFIAHTQAPAAGMTPTQRHRHILNFWNAHKSVDGAGRLRPFWAITSVLGSSLSAENTLADWYRELTAVLGHAEYMGTEGGPQNFHVLFEQFFDAFDKSTRFDHGIFTTPPALTQWMARVTDELLARHFGGRRMADVADTVIDPCCGTGGFLEAVVSVTNPKSEHLPTFVGFEILPAPYALASYRLDHVLRDTPFADRVRILLTDTLSDRLTSPPPAAGNGFTEELNEAGALAKRPMRVVIGNPPVTDHVSSTAPRSMIEKMLDDFRPPRRLRTDRQNVQKRLNNEAFRFLRWCAQKVLDSGSGVLSIVLPGAFAYGVTYKYARRWLIENFQHLYVILLDQDVRTGESNSPPLFKGVQQGRLALFAVRSPAGSIQTSSDDQKESSMSTTLTEINFWDISDLSLALKESNLSRSTLDGFESVTVFGPEWRLMPRGPYPADVWEASWPLRRAYGVEGIFRSKCSAVKLAPTAMLFHTDETILRRRSLSVAARTGTRFSNTYEELQAAWWKGQRKPPQKQKFTKAVRIALGNAAEQFKLTVRPYSYRPFVQGYAIVDDNLFDALGSTPGGGTRARPEIRAAFDQGAKGIAVAPAPMDLGATLTRFASFSWCLPDNDIASRGNAMIYCDRFPEERHGGDWEDSVRSNIAPTLGRLFGGDDPASSVVFYTYAVLSSQCYLDRFESVLYGPANPDSPPRIPVSNSADVLRRLAHLGEALARCERDDQLVQKLDALDIDWPPELAEFRLAGHSLEPEDGVVVLKRENDSPITISGIPADVVALRISGHDVVAKWLRDREYAYLRRTFRLSDAELLLNVLSRIAHQLRLIDQIDELVKPLLRLEALEMPPPIR